MLELVERRVASFGARPCLDGRSALHALLKSKDLYSTSTLTVKTFDPKIFTITSSGVVAAPLRDRLPPEGLELMDQARRRIFRSARDWNQRQESGEVPPIYPYWDVRLRQSPALRLKLFKDLIACGLVGLRLRLRARAALFFVAKKDGTLRMIVDAREASAMCRRPPRTALGSASAVASLDLCDEVITEAFGDEKVEIHGASADLRQGFYQLHWKEMGSMFGFDYPTSLGSFDGARVFDEESSSYLDLPAETLVYPVFEGLPMGWSWSLHFCNLITEDCLRVGVSRALGLAPSDIPVLREGGPLASLGSSRVVVASYVDNGNIIGTDQVTTDLALKGFLEELDRRDLKYHEVEKAATVFVTGGTIFDFARRRCHAKPDRAWRLYVAMAKVLTMGGCTPAALGVIVGHLTYHFMLLRPALAAMDHVYRYMDSNVHAFLRFPTDLVQEFRTLKGLIFLAVKSLGSPWSGMAYCSDACLSGYALAECDLGSKMTRHCGRMLEKCVFANPLANTSSPFTTSPQA